MNALDAFELMESANCKIYFTSLFLKKKKDEKKTLHFGVVILLWKKSTQAFWNARLSLEINWRQYQ